jgi:hypothetical protein
MQTHKVVGVSRASVGAAVVILLAFLSYSFAFAEGTGTIAPSSDGFYSQWTPSTGTSHFALVDEASCNGITDSNSTTVVGNRDSYGVSLALVPNGATITQIDIKPCASRVSGGGSNPVMNVFYRLNSVNSADSGSYSLSGTTPIELATTTYSGLSFVKSAVSTMEIGAVLTSGTKGTRLSRIVTNITYTALTSPTNLAGTVQPSSATSTTLRLTWSDTSSNETGFSLESSTDAVNWVAVATTSANATSYVHAGLSPLTTYYHRVRAFNSGAYTSFSNVAISTTADTLPAAPSGLTVTPSFMGSSTWDMILDWSDNATNETGFSLQRSVNGGAYVHVDPSRTAGTYSYRVRSFNSGGNSAFSTSASTTIP